MLKTSLKTGAGRAKEACTPRLSRYCDDDGGDGDEDDGGVSALPLTAADVSWAGI